MAKLTDVFIIREASIRAWQMIGLTAQDKAEFEETFEKKAAYDMAIVSLIIRKAHREGTHCESVVAAIEGGFMLVTRIERELRRGNSKLRDALSVAAEDFKKMSPNEGVEALQMILDKNNSKAPEEYNARAPFIELEGGWKWQWVDTEHCRDYEGQLMQHCGQSNELMLSLRDPQGHPHVTVDINMRDNTISQLRGKQNRAPDKKYHSAIFKMFEKLKQQNGSVVTVSDDHIVGEAGGIEFLQQAEDAGLIVFEEPTMFAGQLFDDGDHDEDAVPEEEELF